MERNFVFDDESFGTGRVNQSMSFDPNAKFNTEAKDIYGNRESSNDSIMIEENT